MKIKKILVTQPEPNFPNSPYNDLAAKYNLKIDFRPFIHVEGVQAKDFRKDRINILDFSAVVFNSRSAIDHFFRLSQEMRVTIPDTMKYFCISEATAHYLQKYTVYRKRKIFFGAGKLTDLLEVMVKHKEEKFLVPLSDIHKDEVPEKMNTMGFTFKQAVMYRTVCSDLSDLKDVNYDVLVFFSPSDIKSLFSNFPDFKQNETKIAAFGHATAKAVRDAELKVDIEAPLPETPSMTSALDKYITEYNKNHK
ncbi:MAG: uroporphyrinogen-III synthase [Marinilabiliales bacterium]|nr:uroporphyrinogen-III synthase [Marinilabiliales bacterium]